jgi:integrase
MRLFGGIDLEGIRERSELLLTTAVGRAPNTEHGYASDWRVFTKWCFDSGRDALPCTAETLRIFALYELDRLDRRVTTVRRHLASIIDVHRRKGLPEPSTAEARRVIGNVRRERREQPKGKLALEPPDLVRVAELCDPTSNSGMRDRAVVVLGFATALRRSELARVQLNDVTFEPQGIRVRIPYSKTDQDGIGDVIDVWPGQRESTDPVRVLKAWIAKRGTWEGPLFCPVIQEQVRKKGITGESITNVMKRVCARAGLDPAGYAAHSLRAGAVTASSDIGREDGEIAKKLSRHRNVAMIRIYNRGRRAFAGRNPLEGVL